ncbi:uncharacterized protein PFLUO_LOCUS4984 [Penicillium psychrofluorescens]|uniref:uncharacterized protein n=1 Tax=Penicillium psychrofluorescens TaxID=3158075 RepID=UPI003CCDA76F
MNGDLDLRPAKRPRYFDDPGTRDSDPDSLDASLPRHCPGLKIGDPETAQTGDDGQPPEPAQPAAASSQTADTATPKASTTDFPTPESSSLQHGPTQPEPGSNTPAEPACATQGADGFDVQLFTSIIGQELPPPAVKKIQSVASNDMERAVNMYFDGTWVTAKVPNGTKSARQSTLPKQPDPNKGISTSSEPQIHDSTPVEGPSLWRKQPASRYIGALGVGGWATRSGKALIKHGDIVNIERARSQPLTKRGRGGKLLANHKPDVLTRFTTTSGQELGRLPHETAEWVSTLIDQKICRFEAVCVYVPDWVRVNDTIYLQLRCFLRKEVFQRGVFTGMPEDDNRSTALFEEKESTEEKKLRIRQVALVRLFHEVGLQPTSINPTTEKHKREGLLRAAEMAEQYDKKDKSKGAKDANDSSEEDETQELEEDQLDTLYKKAQSFDFNMPEAEPASTFTMNLRKYQKQALHWMLAKEKDTQKVRERSLHPLWEEYTWPTKDVDEKDLPTVEGIDQFYVNPYSGDLSIDFPAQEQHCRGGVLADEMGLGKTIEMMSLIHSHKAEPKPRELADAKPLTSLNSNFNNASSEIVPAPYTTLVVAPTSLLSQWESEALKASEAGSMRVMVYHGPDRGMSIRDICSESKPNTAPHLIITSYGIVLSQLRDLPQQHMPGSPGGLFSVEFFRVILDEAHSIKNRRSKSARACYELKAVHRWALTGTPIVNRLEDLFSLVRFLKVEPWSNFSFWKTFITVPFESKEFVRALNVVQSVLEPLVLRRTKTMKTPEGEPLVPLPKRTITIEEVELSQQEREIYDCIYMRAKRTFNEGVETGTLLQSYSTIFAQILRLRQTCCHPILTRKKEIVADEETAAAAADELNGLKDDMDLQELINQFTTSTESASNEDRPGATATFTAHALRQIQTESSGECPICCEEPMIDPAVTACWHSACKKCLADFLRHQMNKGEQARCFNCRAPVNAKDIFEVVRHPSSHSTTPLDDGLPSGTPPADSQPAPRISLRRIYPLSPSAHTSAKIHALLTHLSRVAPNTKSVVFSQFTSFLDLIGPQLTRMGISHVRLDGSMPHKARAAVLAQFSKAETYDDEIIDAEDEPPSISRAFPGATTTASSSSSSSSPPTVLLISLRAGGVGLNLTTASNVFIMDPWWSFAIEAQAIDRVHRMGQTRDVFVTRFVVKDSIEGRMLRVQDRKMNIAGSLGLRVGGDEPEEDKRKERIAELKLLFE